MKVQNIAISTVTIQVEELDQDIDLLSLNFDEDGNRLESFRYKWCHLSGLGLMNPRCGLGFTVEDCIAQATEAMQ